MHEAESYEFATFRPNKKDFMVKIYDTTLRDGNQARGLSFSLADKLHIAKKLDDFGVDYIEGGWPNPTNPIDVDFFKKMAEYPLRHSKIAAFGSTRRPKKSCEEDPILGALVEAQADAYTIFGKSWDIHVTDVIRTTLEENLLMIEESIRFLKSHADEVFYDAEHFFDGYKANPEYALQTIQAAHRGGADCIVLCDTNGGMALPWEVQEIVKIVRSQVSCEIGVHCHNDTESAVANSLAAVAEGATQIQGCINGIGERCGNANLTTIIPNLHFKMNHELTCSPQLAKLNQLSHYVDQVANIPSNIRAPYVGEAAFAHKGGAHIDGVMKISYSFEHLDPAAIGNKREFIISDQAGGALIVGRLGEIFPDLDKKDPRVKSILEEVKDKETQGYYFETAGGSFELIARRQLSEYVDPVEVLSYRVIEELRSDGALLSEATVKVKIDDKILHRVAEGDGPVNALDAAFRLALSEELDFISKVSLDDYKVRVLDSEEGSAASVRVWATFSDGEDSWNTAGVSENIIEASWAALMDGFNYKIMKEMSHV